MFRLLATADPNIAQIPHSHFVYMQLLKAAASAEQQEFFFRLVLDGARLANAQTARGGKTAKEISTDPHRDRVRLPAAGQ